MDIALRVHNASLYKGAGNVSACRDLTFVLSLQAAPDRNILSGRQRGRTHVAAHKDAARGLYDHAAGYVSAHLYISVETDISGLNIQISVYHVDRFYDHAVAVKGDPAVHVRDVGHRVVCVFHDLEALFKGYGLQDFVAPESGCNVTAFGRGGGERTADQRHGEASMDVA